MTDPRRPPSRPPTDWAMYLLWGTLIAILALSAWLISMKPAPPAKAVPVPRTNLPAYHLLQATDLMTKALSADSIPENTVDALSGLVGLYTQTSLSANEPITAGQVHTVSDPALISGTVSIGIPATPAMVMGDNLQAGDIVDILLVPTNTEMSPEPQPSLFEDILVLDVGVVPESQKVEDGVANRPFVVVIALSADRRLEFASTSSRATFLITREP